MFTALLFGALIRTRFVPALAWLGLVMLAGGAAVLTGVAGGPQSLVIVGSGLVGIGVGSSVAPALFTTGFSLRAGQLPRVFAMLELLRGAAAFAVGADHPAPGRPRSAATRPRVSRSPCGSASRSCWPAPARRCTCSCSAAVASRSRTSRPGTRSACRPGIRRRWPPGSATRPPRARAATAPGAASRARGRQGRGARPRAADRPHAAAGGTASRSTRTDPPPAAVSRRSRRARPPHRGQDEIHRGHVLAQMGDRGGAGDQQDVGRALQQPRERDRHRRRLEPVGDGVQRVGLQRGETAEREVGHIGDAVRRARR